MNTCILEKDFESRDTILRKTFLRMSVSKRCSFLDILVLQETSFSVHIWCNMIVPSVGWTTLVWDFYDYCLREDMLKKNQEQIDVNIVSQCTDIDAEKCRNSDQLWLCIFLQRKKNILPCLHQKQARNWSRRYLSSPLSLYLQNKSRNKGCVIMAVLSMTAGSRKTRKRTRAVSWLSQTTQPQCNDSSMIQIHSSIFLSTD